MAGMARTVRAVGKAVGGGMGAGVAVEEETVETVETVAKVAKVEKVETVHRTTMIGCIGKREGFGRFGRFGRFVVLSFCRFSLNYFLTMLDYSYPLPQPCHQVCLQCTRCVANIGQGQMERIETRACFVVQQHVHSCATVFGLFPAPHCHHRGSRRRGARFVPNF